MNERPQLSERQAEELRLALKEWGWALAHLRNFYNLSKPDNAPAELENPNQLKLFDNGDRQ